MYAECEPSALTTAQNNPANRILSQLRPLGFIRDLWTAEQLSTVTHSTCHHRIILSRARALYVPAVKRGTCMVVVKLTSRLLKLTSRLTAQS